MNKNSQEVIAKIRSVCESKAEVMLAKLNGVDTSIMRGKLKSAKELTKTLMESESRFWTDKKAAPSSAEFKVRFATLLTGYVICNLDRYIETYYMTVTQTEDRESVNLKELMNEIIDLIQDMCKSAVNGSSRFYEVIYTLAVVDVVSNKPEHKVCALSYADIPVVTPFFNRSIDTVKGVECIEVLLVTIIGKSSSSQRSDVSGAQIKPLACVSMKFIFSGVIASAAIIKSPSFSRSSSSTTITKLPFLISSIASSTVSSLILSIIILFPVCFCHLIFIISRSIFFFK